MCVYLYLTGAKGVTKMATVPTMSSGQSGLSGERSTAANRAPSNVSGQNDCATVALSVHFVADPIGSEREKLSASN